MTESRQSVAGAYERIESHEQVCAERHSNVLEKLSDLKGTINKIVWLIITTLIAVVGWMAMQMWDGVKPVRDVAHVEQAPAQPTVMVQQ